MVGTFVLLLGSVGLGPAVNRLRAACAHLLTVLLLVITGVASATALVNWAKLRLFSATLPFELASLNLQPTGLYWGALGACVSAICLVWWQRATNKSMVDDLGRHSADREPVPAPVFNVGTQFATNDFVCASFNSLVRRMAQLEEELAVCQERLVIRDLGRLPVTKTRKLKAKKTHLPTTLAAVNENADMATVTPTVAAAAAPPLAVPLATTETATPNTTPAPDAFSSAMTILADALTTLTAKVDALQARPPIEPTAATAKPVAPTSDYRRSRQSSRDSTTPIATPIRVDGLASDEPKWVRWADIVSTSSEDSLCSDDESFDAYPTIAQSLAYPVLPKTKFPRTPKVPKTIQEAEIVELKKQLADARAEQQELKKRQAILTEEEKQLSREELRRKWLSESRRQRRGDRPDRPLTAEEATLSKTALKRKWAEEDHNAFIETQRARGIPIVTCEGCGRLKPVNDQHHWCHRGLMRYGTGTRQQEILVTGNTSGIRVSKQPVVDIDVVNKELERLTKLKQQVDAQQRTRDAPATLPLPPAADTPMTEATSSSSALIPPPTPNPFSQGGPRNDTPAVGAAAGSRRR